MDVNVEAGLDVDAGTTMPISVDARWGRRCSCRWRCRRELEANRPTGPMAARLSFIDDDDNDDEDPGGRTASARRWLWLWLRLWLRWSIVVAM